MPPVIDKDKCEKCGTCADVCQMDVFFGSKENKIPTIRYPEECWHCAACVIDCPVDAVRLRVPYPMMVCYK